MDVSFGWSQETESGGWRKINCAARESDDDLRKVLSDYLMSRRDVDLAITKVEDHFGVVRDILQTECEFYVLTKAYQVSGRSESVGAELARVVNHRNSLIKQVTTILEPSDTGSVSDHAEIAS